MPVKRKAVNSKSKAVASKQSKTKDDDEPDLKQKISELKQVTDKKSHVVDKHFPVLSGLSYRIYEDYDCTLNQTDISNNNNKFYIIQLVTADQTPCEYQLWTRWGRVGEQGQTALLTFLDVIKATGAFEKKFREKTANAWPSRKEFVSRPKKYTMVEVLGSNDETTSSLSVTMIYAPSKLESHTEQLIQRIFNASMFDYTLKQLNIDTNKMPLGKLSSKQIAMALEVLDELSDVIQKKRNGDLDLLSSRFYTLMPHSFGRRKPPVISEMEHLRAKVDMMLVLSDVCLAQKIQSEIKPPSVKNPNPVDAKYDCLNCDLVWLDKNDDHHKLITEFFTNTGNPGRRIYNIWRVSRRGEDSAYLQHSKLSNRKLLWHGTSVAVVAAILKSGLRIMPHSGGLVGRGIYFASQASKSQSYGTGDTDGHRLMFVAEVALGKEHYIYQCQHDLIRAPDGYDSVVAFGKMETEPNLSKTMSFENRDVGIPYAKPALRETQSCFYFSEYVIYRESQCRLRYVVEYQ